MSEINLSHKWAIWLLLMCVRATVGEYHVLSSKLFTDHDLTNDSYFGYSVTYQASTRRLIVGAPKANVTGLVYTIDIDRNAATLVEIPQVIKENADHINSSVTSHKNFLLGATVKAGGNFFVMCAPKNAEMNQVKNELRVLGKCFYNLNNGTIRLTDSDKLTSSFPSKPYGWSLDVTETNAVIIAALAVSNGLVKVIQNGKKYSILPKMVSYSFGYGVASGKHFDANGTDTSSYYAISTPHGINGMGKVLFFDASNFHYKTAINDLTVGSLFGAALCTMNLGDSRDYLMVGAPTYSKDNIIDRGVVYLYAVNATKYNLHKTIESSSEAYFGYSLANLGDMDGDKRDEVAIGAPYEDDGRGAVYIYSGARLLDPHQNGKQMLIQRIQPEPNSRIRSFGFSLTTLQDFDENGCNELAIGAPDSNSVVVYKCFAFITINLQAIFPPKTELRQKRENDTYTFQSCIAVKFPGKPRSINENIRIKVKIIHQDAWFLDHNSTKSNTMTYNESINRKQSKYCKDIKFITDKNGNFEELVSYVITASLSNDPHNITEFSSTRVVLSSQSNLILVGQESLADCEGLTCEPKLSMVLKSNIPNPYTVGSTPEESFSFIINNKGDIAYSACLLVQIMGAPLLRLPQGCTDNGNNLICTPTILLKKHINWETGKITLDMRDLTSKNEKITISYKLYNRCNNRTSPVDSSVTNYNLNSEMAGVNITSESDPADVVEIFSDTIRVRQMYTIANSGPTTWEDVNIDVVLMKETNVIKYEMVSVEVEDERETSCGKPKVERNDEFFAYCNSITLKKGKKVKVIIPFPVSPVDGKNADVVQKLSTKLKLHLKTHVIHSSATTELQFKQSSVPLWIIVTAILLGLMLLILLGYALFSLGFLKRHKKGKLEKLKKSVHKQGQKPTRSMLHCEKNNEKVEIELADRRTDVMQDQQETQHLI